MPDLDPLPGRPRVPDFRPRTGDYAAVVGRAKNRRRRHLTTASAGAAGVAVVVALSVGGGGGTLGLKPVPPAAPGGSVVPTATPEESPTPEVSEPAHPGESAEPGERGAAEPSAGPGGAAGEPSPHPEPSAPGPDGDHSGEQPPPPRAQRPVVVRDSVPFRTTDTCQTNASFVAATGWCLGYEGPSVVQIGVPATFRLLACRPTGRGGQTFRFETEQQVEFVVSSGERAEWHWSGGYRFPKKENTVYVAESTCARWSIEWDGTGDDGDPLRPGTYTMSTEVLAPYSEQFATTTSNGGTVEVVE